MPGRAGAFPYELLILSVVATLIVLAPPAHGQNLTDSLVRAPMDLRHLEVLGAGAGRQVGAEALPGYDTNCAVLTGTLCVRTDTKHGAPPVAIATVQNEQRESRGKVALRGLFWGALIGGVIGYSTAEEKFGGERYFGAVGGALIGAPIGMVVYLLITPL